MITGAHAIIYSADPDGVRAFFRDVLELPCVDAGHGWLIFALPPAEIAAHPTGGAGGAHPTGAGGRHECEVPWTDRRKHPRAACHGELASHRPD